MNKHGGYYGEDHQEITDFSVNINPLGVPELLIEALKKELEEMVRYPEIDGISGREFLAHHLGLKSENFILGNGATELIYLFARSIRAEKVLIVKPTFTEYSKAFELAGSSIYNYYTKEEDFTLQIEELISTIDHIKPNVLVICNPNNPTGVFTESKELIPVLDKLKEINAYLFIDESFIDFTDKESCMSFVEEYNIFILRSMTKIYAVPGLRIGYGIGREDIVSKLNEMKEPWTINSLALRSIPLLLKDDQYLKQTQQWYFEEKQFLYNELRSIPDIKIIPSETNFFLIKLLRHTSESLKEYLLDKKIFVRSCKDFEGLSDKYIRIAVRKREENMKIIYAIKKYMEQ
ncbi:threonine-phosphate decarboxylase CobD [Proteiniborus sp. MB09-C3]|uniref:threonine-phosphate decarboxylase CobD n=1 Tax=Proteiniborus sp. MB09-C3 TaxID=3050072 RepID=UPI002554FEC7|nr:threonine-phosphate decarboxylase CobD [Proteiniborus sp. MB09-C3]WIV11818.1 threonine-phosphate decarboxylase CobD [Proteiniborus sp. MB09-C3]